MSSLSGRYALVVGVNRSHRLKVSDGLRKTGAVVVEAMTVPQAEAVLRQIRFELVFVDFVGAGAAMLGFIENVRAEDPEARILVSGPPADCHMFAKLQSPDLTKLGFGNTPDSIGVVLSGALEEADVREFLDKNVPTTACPRATEANDRQE